MITTFCTHGYKNFYIKSFNLLRSTIITSIQNINNAYISYNTHACIHQHIFQIHWEEVWVARFSCLGASAYVCPCPCPWSLISLNIERNEFKLSEDAPPKIHNSIELNEFIVPGFPPPSATGIGGWVSWFSGGGGWVAGFSGGPFVWIGGGAGWPPRGGFGVTFLNGFNRVMWRVEARIVEEVMWKSGCCWNCDRLFCINLCKAGTYEIRVKCKK